MSSVWLAGGIFLIAYALIVTERVDRTVSALLGGVAMILVGLLSQEQAFHAVDWNVIFLLAGMMVLANVLRETGLFQWIAVQAVRLGRGNPYRILVILSLVTAVASALLDNVAIVILVAPVTLLVAASLRVSPLPFLIAGILASNIGGTATLIGDPPNILIGSAAGILASRARRRSSSSSRRRIHRRLEHYLDGKGRLELPFGMEEGPKVDQGGNLVR